MSKSRIVFDVSNARGGGGFTYAVNVIPVLARRLAHAEILVAVRSRRIAESLPTLENLTVHLMPEAGVAERLRFLAHGGPSLAKKFEADLYYSASELSPFLISCPKIAAFRNAALFTTLDLHWPIKQKLRMALLKSLARQSVRTCSKILFVSHDSAHQIGDAFGIPDQKRVVVPHGINPDLWSGEHGTSPFERPYILSVSSIYRYKNFVRLIDAWTGLARRWPEVPDLAIVGDDQDPLHSREMRQARDRAGVLADRIHLVGEVPYAQIARYYCHARAFVFPSYLETFGHPLLEAMAAGLPVVAADIGIFREIGGDAALYCDPYSTESIADSLEQALRTPETRDRLVDRGYRRITEYSWARAVDGMAALFSEVLGPVVTR